MTMEEDELDDYEWPDSNFQQIDNILHCDICKEFLKTAMATSCGHIFCSLCIRQVYDCDQDYKCPTCRTKTNGELKHIKAFDDLVENFLSGRKKWYEIMTAKDDSSVSGKKRKRDDESDGVYDSDEVVIVEEKISLLTCPVCNTNKKKWKNDEDLTVHVNKCLEQTNTKTPKTKNTENLVNTETVANNDTKSTVKKLTKPWFKGKKDKDLRQELVKYGISSSGSREILEKRFTLFINIWNSFVDSGKAFETKDVLNELSERESCLVKSSPMIKDQNDLDKHVKKYNDEFSSLINSAKPKKNEDA